MNKSNNPYIIYTIGESMKLTFKDAIGRMPQYLYDKLLEQYDRNIVDSIIKGYMTTKLTTLRVNSLISTPVDILNELKKENIKCERTSFYKDGLIIKNSDERKIQEMFIYNEGYIYLQNLSSMLPPIILNPKKNTNILDMCAAPGSKTSQLCALVNNESNIYACELDMIRHERLKYNLNKQHCENVTTFQMDARKLSFDFLFDSILLDAPCSGSGTIDLNDKKTYVSFSEKLVIKSSNIQYALLKKAIEMLKSGKTMVYSTCSILRMENEDVVNRILKECPNVEVVPIYFEGMNNLPTLPTPIKGSLLVRPSELYEGFYVCKLKKK